MPLFRSRKDSSPPQVQVELPNNITNGLAVPGHPRRSNSVVSMTSNDSIKTTSSLSSATGKFKTIFGLTTSNGSKGNISIDHELDKLHVSSRESSTSPLKESTLVLPKSSNDAKRISTIAETSSTCSTDYEDSESDDEECSDDDDGELHSHPVKVKKYTSEQHNELIKSLSNTLMHYCGFKKNTDDIKNYKQLKEYADSESKQTYSLLDSTNKIHKLSKNLNGVSIIGDAQIELIKNLTIKIEKLIKRKQYDLIIHEKSMFQRYGVVKQVIGRGAYGLIKIIDPDANTASPTSLSFNFNRHLYAVKQWFPRKTESHDHFVERILSEFVIQSTLNNEHIATTVDLMCGIPMNNHSSSLQFSQVMSCNQGGDLYSYLTNPLDVSNKSISFITLDEVDCWMKQITEGLNYMHNHGVSHCDLKLENILISYEPIEGVNCNKSSMILKISDFGKSYVFRTKFDTSEQLLDGQAGPIGTKPYIPPEEFIAKAKSSQYSSIKKDCWSLGIVMLVLLNIRRHYYSGISSNVELDRRFRYVTDDDFDDYGTGFLWETSEFKQINKSYKDRNFNEFANKKMIADYDTKTKEWLVKRSGHFKPIDDICKLLTVPKEDDDDSDEDNDDSKQCPYSEENDDELNELRVMILYKLLDISPNTRMTTDQLLSSDWMTCIDIC